MLRSILALVCASLFVSSSAQAVGTEATPSSKWLVDFVDNECVASRSYSVGNESWVAGIQPYPTSNNLSLLVIAPERKPSLERSKVRIAGSEIEQSDLVYRGTDERGRWYYRTFLAGEEPERLRTSGGFEVELEGRSLHFPMTEIAQLGPILQSCTADLLARWGVSEEQQARIASYPELVEGSAKITSDDYPNKAMERDETGQVIILMTIAATGEMRDCNVVKSSGSNALDERTCGIYRKRGRFTPARDTAGLPVEAPLLTQVQWSIRDVLIAAKRSFTLH